MSRLKLGLRMLASAFLLVGLLHLVLGPRADVMLGAVLPLDIVRDPVLDSQNRFYGTAFMIYGALLGLVAEDPRAHRKVLRLVALFVFLGGASRLVSAAVVGWPTPAVLFLGAVELLAPPLVVTWHARAVERG